MDKATVLRLVILLAAVLANFGINLSNDVQGYITGAIMLIVVAWGFIKHNYFGKNAVQKKQVVEQALQTVKK